MLCANEIRGTTKIAFTSNGFMGENQYNEWVKTDNSLDQKNYPVLQKNLTKIANFKMFITH